MEWLNIELPPDASVLNSGKLPAGWTCILKQGFALVTHSITTFPSGRYVAGGSVTAVSDWRYVAPDDT
jgi:hypothetical protein